MINDYIVRTLKNIIRNKKNILLILIFSLLLILLFLDLTFIKNAYSYIDYSTNTNIAFRTFTASKDNTTIAEVTKKIKELDNVAEVYDSFYRTSIQVESDLKFNELNGNLQLIYGTENITPPSIKGKSIKDLKSGEMICPIDFYPNSLSDGFNIDDSKIVAPEESLNNEFNVYYSIFKYEEGSLDIIEESATKRFKIVGLYDSKLVMNENNTCYITAQDIKEMGVNQSLNNSDTDDSNYVSIDIVVDKVKNLNKVRNKVASLGYYVSKEANAYFDTKEINSIFLLAYSFFLIIIGVIFFMYVSYLHKKAKSESNLWGILRACGYTMNDILKKEIVEIVIILFVSFIISSIIFSTIFSLVIKDYFKYTTYSGFYVKNSILFLFLSFIILLFILIFIEKFIVRKTIDKPISNLLMED